MKRLKRKRHFAYGRLVKCLKCDNLNSCTVLLYGKGNKITYFDEFCSKPMGGCGYKNAIIDLT